jgi:hypothetical protein
MPDNPKRPFHIDAAVLDLLACPVCLGGLSVQEERLVCAACGRGFPIVDGIPVLIAERAAKPGAKPE